MSELNEWVMDLWINEWMSGWKDEGMDGWIKEWMDGWIKGWMNGWRDGFVNSRAEMQISGKPVNEGKQGWSWMIDDVDGKYVNSSQCLVFPSGQKLKNTVTITYDSLSLSLFISLSLSLYLTFRSRQKKTYFLLLWLSSPSSSSSSSPSPSSLSSSEGPIVTLKTSQSRRNKSLLFQRLLIVLRFYVFVRGRKRTLGDNWCRFSWSWCMSSDI